MHYQTKQRFVGAIRNLNSFIYNLFYFANRSQEDNDFAALRNLVLSLPNEVKMQYAEECAYLETMPLSDLHLIMLPYPLKDDMYSSADSIVLAKEKGLFYVLHNNKSKLFFPKSSVGNEYISLVYKEGLLGTGHLAKSPHCYQDDTFKVENGDILLDVGCAEAIFALDNVDKVSKAYLFESDPAWRKPLQLTFAPYADKVVIVNKLVADKTTRKSTRLMDAVKNDMTDNSHFFVKMDIEGWERTVIEGNADFFKAAKVKLSCCVYHRQDDAQVIDEMLKSLGYKTRFSDGYMLPTMNGIHYPYFRHGVIYAQNY